MSAKHRNSLKRTNARTAALIVCLGVLALLLGSVNAGLSAPLTQLEQGFPQIPSLAKASHTEAIETGAILVRASLYDGALPVAPVTPVTPVANATVKILLEAQGVLPLLLETNSSGEAQAQIEVGNYTLTVSSPYFSALADVRVYPNVTTEADVSVTMMSDQVVFSDLSDGDSSGYVAPWQSITLAVDASQGMPNSSAYFLDLSHPQGVEAALGGPYRPVQVPVTIASSQVSGSGSSGLIWLTVHPGTFVPLQGATALALVTYTATTRITFHGY